MKAKIRQAGIARNTKETQIAVNVNLDGKGRADLVIGIPFFEHMLTLLAGHGLLDLKIRAQGDLAVDQHHLVEDIGIAMGQCLAKAWGDKHGMVRYGWALIPMDEVRVLAALDISNRPFLEFDLQLRQKRLGGFDTELALEFFRALTNAAGLTLHLVQQTRGNTHHAVEAAFKAFGRALRQAVARDPRQSGIPSTKGCL